MLAHAKQNVEAGLPLEKASKALIMLHGRGSTAQDILSLQNHFDLDGFYIVAPQATNNTWYPYSFLAPVHQNEPWLSSALDLLSAIVMDLHDAGIHSDKIYLLGFSQGACLTLEFAARNAQKWGGVIAFTGGLIGDKISQEKYKGDFGGSKAFIGNSDKDPHVPQARSEESQKLMEKMGANVTLRIYQDMAHTINRDEIKSVNEIFFNVQRK